MARLFANASSKSLVAGSAVLSDYPFSIACWAKASDFSTGIGLGCIGTTAAAQRQQFDCAGGNVRLVSVDGSADTASSSTTASLNTWFHALGVAASATSRAAYLNGGSKGTSDSGNIAWGSYNNTAIGRLFVAGGGEQYYFSGDIAEFAIWNVALTDDEAAILGAGYSPLFVRPGNLVGYWPLHGRQGATAGEEDWVGTFALTDTGDPAVSDHPRIIYPGRRRIYLPSAGAAPVNVNLTGLAATAAVGSFAPAASVALAGLASTGAVGSFAPSASVAVAGLAAEGAVGSLAPSTGVNVALSGHAATAELGSIAAQISQTLTGNAATADVGSLLPSVGATVALAGNAAAAEVGSLAPSLVAAPSGLAATAAVGTFAASTAITAALSGVAATAQVGSLSLEIDVSLAGLAASSAVGSLTASQAGGTVTVSLSGLGATGAVGSLAAHVGAHAYIDRARAKRNARAGRARRVY